MVLQLDFWACTPFVVIKLGYPLVPAPPRGRSGPVAPQRRERRRCTPPWTTMGAASVSCAARRRSRRHGTRRSTEALGPCSLGLCWDLRSGAWRGGARRVQWPWAAPPLSQRLPGARYPCSLPWTADGPRVQRGFAVVETTQSGLCTRCGSGARPARRVWGSHGGAPGDGIADGTRYQGRTALGLKHSGKMGTIRS